MTPSAITPAGRGARTKAPAGQGGATRAPTGQGGGARAAGARTAGHRNKLRHESAPHAPRRVSGPLSGLRRGRAVPSSPRRTAPRPRTAPAAEGRGLVARACAFVRALPDHALLDRLIRGRVWIPLLGVLLAGIVAMQVEVLKLGASMGRSLEATTSLQSRNEQLQATVATLADDQRIERLAAGMGMIMPDPDAVNFLSAGPVGSANQVVASIHQPDALAFTANLPASSAPGGGATSAATPVDATAAPGTATAATDSSTSATSTG